MPILPWIAAALGTAFSFLVKHPLVLKMMFFPAYMAILYYAINMLATWLSPMIQFPFLATVACFGFFDALNLFLSILVAGFLLKHTLRFISG